MNGPKVKYDFFIEVDGVDHICEIYETDGTHVIDYGIYRLLDDGSNGDPIEEPGYELELEVQDHWFDHITSRHEDDVL